MFNELIKTVNTIDNRIKITPIKLSDIIFEERVKLNCFYCTKYNINWRCPPNIPDLNYYNIISEYDNLAIVYIIMDINNNFDFIRIDSTNKLHKSLLVLEQYFWNNNNSLATSFIGGSCKLCQNGCDKDKCKQPLRARIPIEAIGINVIKTLQNIGININFPITNQLFRGGMILW